MIIAEKLQRRWYENRPPPWWTLPWAALFGGIVRLRRALYRHGVLPAHKLPIPVIVVGNITVGGAGKTPLTIALVEALRARGFKPGVVSRGHGGSARTPMLLEAQPDPAVCGDEPALIRMRTGCSVAIGTRRFDAARLLLAQGVDSIVADDGLQHYALARDVEICVVDGARYFGNGRLFPAGPLREPESRLAQVDFVVCNGGAPRNGEVRMQLALANARALADPARAQPLAAFAGRHVHAVAGIGNPARFFTALRDLGLDVVEHPFPDHHRFIAGDFSFDDGAPVLMTEKDAVKCRAFAQPGWWAVPATAELPAWFLDALVAQLSRESPEPPQAT